METSRRCTKCNTVKPIDEFRYSHKSAGYRRHECKSCESQRKSGWYNANYARETHQRMQYYHEHKERIQNEDFRKRNKQYQKVYRDRLRQKVLNAYGRKCVCCGETESRFLTVDHKNNDGYAMRKYRGHPRSQASFMKWIIDNGYPDNFQILCMNCNWGKAMNGGVCPHQEGSTTISQESTAKRLEAHCTQMGDDMVCSVVKVTAVLQ